MREIRLNSSQLCNHVSIVNNSKRVVLSFDDSRGFGTHCTVTSLPVLTLFSYSSSLECIRLINWEISRDLAVSYLGMAMNVFYFISIMTASRLTRYNSMSAGITQEKGKRSERGPDSFA